MKWVGYLIGIATMSFVTIFFLSDTLIIDVTGYNYINHQRNWDHTEFKSVNITPNISNVEKVSIPGTNKDKTIYIMNTIYLPYDQMISIHLLGNRWWWSTDPLFKETLITDWAKYIKSANLKIYCSFPYNSTYLTSQIVIVPNVLYSQHKESTETFLCKIPDEIIPFHQKYPNQTIYPFIIMTSNESIIVELQYNIKQRSIWPLITKYNNTNLSKRTLISVCIPSIRHPIPFIIENIAYYISQGIQHIYIGTFFHPKEYEHYMDALLNLIKPWYDSGQITIMNLFLPDPIRQSNAYIGTRFRIQCLYLAKAFGDEFTLNTDADEFLVFHNNLTIYYNIKYNYYKDIHDKCWVIFDEYEVWKLTNPNSSYLVPRYTEINANGGDSYLTNSCKALWNNKYLWSIEVHAGGACNIRNSFGFKWNQTVKNYKNWGGWRKSKKPNPSKLVKIMNIEYEASVRHFINAIHPRVAWIPRNYSMEDSCALNKIIWRNIEYEFELKSWNHSTFSVDNSKYDILYDKDYGELFRKGNSMKNITMNDFNYTKVLAKWTGDLKMPHYDESLDCH